MEGKREDAEKVEKLSLDYQKVREQLQSISIQRDRFNSQKIELNQASEEIEKNSREIYSTIGSVIVKLSKEDAIKKISERKELLDTRINLVNKQSVLLAEKEKKLRGELENFLNIKAQRDESNKN